MIAGGVVSETWSLTGDGVAVFWFAEGGPPPVEALATEVARLAAIVDLHLAFSFTGATRRAQTQA